MHAYLYGWPSLRRLLAASLVVLLATVPSWAGGEGSGTDPIDAALSQCLDAPDGQSTQGMVECLGTAYDSWDAALNKEYGSLMDSLEPAQKSALKASQRQWIAYRDSEQKFLQTLVTPDAGTIMRVTTNQAMVEMVKARVLLLRSYGEN
jgi:uncharacterized protein YecT (DUF1311 family)